MSQDDPNNPAIAKEYFDQCDKVVMTPAQFKDLESMVIRDVDKHARRIVKNRTEQKQTDSFPWHESNNTKQYFEQVIGHTVTDRPTITAVGPLPGGNHYLYKCLYWPNIDGAGPAGGGGDGGDEGSALSELCEYYFSTREKKSGRAMNYYEVKTRGGKAS